jgi:uncharacterized protein YceK
MKKLILMVIVLSVILGCISVTACSSGKENGTTPAQTQPQQQNPTATATAKPASGSSESFGGIPIYPGAKLYFKASSDESETFNDKPAVYESRMYTTSANRGDVVAFYKDKMPANGWNETNWMEIGAEAISSIGEYEKNDGQAGAVIQCSDTDKETMLKIDLKYIK